MIDQYDQEVRRCPMLGHDIRFAYCRQPGREIPCGKIYDCWWDKLDIKAFMEANYPPRTLRAVLRPKPAKMMSLLDIIEATRKRQDAAD